MKKSKRVYLTLLISLIIIFSYSIVRAFYYLFTGAGTFHSNGTPSISNLPQWIIPYAAIGFALILVTATQPIFRIFNQLMKHVATFITGVAAFVGFELLFEQIPALSAENVSSLFSAQAYLCYRPVQQFYPGGVPRLFSPSVRLHYYIVSIILILVLSKIIIDYLFAVENKKQLNSDFWVRFLTGIMLLSICIIGNITDFFRNGSRDLPPLSVFLTVTFFIAQSVTMGLFFATFFKSRTHSRLAATLTAILTCVIVYTGEYFVLGGVFYKLGQGWFFNSLFSERTLQASIAPIDICIIIISGIIAFITASFLRKDSYYRFR